MIVYTATKGDVHRYPGSNKRFELESVRCRSLNIKYDSPSLPSNFENTGKDVSPSDRPSELIGTYVPQISYMGKGNCTC